MIYLDNNSTTRIDDRVMEVMIPYFTLFYGNAASNHAFGIETNQAIKRARAQVAELLGAETNEIIFTSGATEAINLALKGVAKSYTAKGKHIITVNTEHSAVLDVCKSLEGDGYEITYLDVNDEGIVNISELEKAIRPDTVLVSVMLVNNEIGTLQPIAEIASIAHRTGAFLMTDATQAVGKIPVNVRELDIDLLALSAHKFYGPKGVGALYFKNKGPRKISIQALLHGGGHERGIRSGTLNVPGIIGLGKCCQLAIEEMKENEKMIGSLRDYLEFNLLSIAMTKLNGSNHNRLYNISNILFKDVSADALIVGLEDIMVSTGSACTSMKTEPSHVLKALGRSDAEAYSSIRFSLGKYNLKEEMDETITRVKAQVKKLRSMVDSISS